MTVTLSESALYVGVTVILIGLQAYQQIMIRNLQKEIKQLWDQISVLATTTVLKIVELKKDINKVEEKIK